MSTIIEIECYRHNHRQIQALQKRRFHHIGHAKTLKDGLLFRRSVCYNDLLVEDCFIDENDGRVVAKKSSVDFNRLFKLFLRSKCDYQMAYVLKQEGVMLLQELLIDGGCILRIYYDDADPLQFESKILRQSAPDTNCWVLHENINYELRRR